MVMYKIVVNEVKICLGDLLLLLHYKIEGKKSQSMFQCKVNCVAHGYLFLSFHSFGQGYLNSHFIDE
jgi:hypothetical protein